MHTYSISHLLDLKDVIAYKVSQTDHTIKVYIKTKPKPRTCPACRQQTSKIHDYRTQEIKDLPVLRKQLILVLRKRRYVCQCGKKFYESYSFLPKYHRMSNRLAAHICEEMRKCIPTSMIAKDSGVSPHTVSRIFGFVRYPKVLKMPKVLCMDEFKGNTDAGKYQCILVDGQSHQILDVLPSRNKSNQIRYISSIPRYERLKVKFFVCDMCGYFSQVARDMFPNATIIKEILNAFKYNYSNGPTEVKNNRIKVLKRVCFGFRNFNRFRNGILHLQ